MHVFSSPTARLRAAVASGLLAVVLAAPLPALAATVSTSYAISGAEYSATQTVGSFAGSASGSSGDSATWQATVIHTVLRKKADITGGEASLATSNLVYIHGDFAGGSVKRTYQAPGCGEQRYAVAGDLVNVTRSDAATIGAGTFAATLIHYRTSVFGSCITYFATVSGTITLTF